MLLQWLSWCQLLVALASVLPPGGVSLRMVRVSVPQYPEMGQAVELLCQFDLQGDRLYSVSWYKDFDEFYRYVPRGSPTKHVYRIDGIKVDLGRSDAGRVMVLSVSLKASGLYMCEVSAEAPSFASVHGQAWMSVISLPVEGPSICGSRLEYSYSIGEELSLNCTAGPSYPATRLQWFLNDNQVKSQSQSVTHRSNQLLSSSVGLQVRLRPEHFYHGQLTVRCVASLPTHAFAPPHSIGYLRESSLIVRGGTTQMPLSRVLLALSLAALTS